MKSTPEVYTEEQLPPKPIYTPIQGRKPRIAIIHYPDAGINTKRAIIEQELLKARGYHVDRLFSSDEARASSGRVPTLWRLLSRVTPEHVKQHAVVFQMRRRAREWKNRIGKGKYDVVICDSETDSYALTNDFGQALKIYNCATPFSDELMFSGKITDFGYRQLMRMELQVYRQAHWVSFRAPYKAYCEKYLYRGPNLFATNGGCFPSDRRAKWDAQPRIVYYGYLGGYWIDLPLLSRLTQRYHNIDVYGYPAPDPKLGLNYKGRVTNDKVLDRYQFGLITVTKDRLRSEGFSAKHVDYLSHGLPVLSPQWRTSNSFFKGTISYTEENFLSTLRRYRTRKTWQAKSNEAYTQAKELTWDKVMQPLMDIVDKHLHRKTQPNKPLLQRRRQ